MPYYQYEHETKKTHCPLGNAFTLEQKISDETLTQCPHCGQEIYRVIQPININAPTADSDLRGKGFTKLVRRDKGVYENVTALDGESRYFHADKPETMPDLNRRKLD